MTRKEKKGFVWKATRISFWTMIVCWILSIANGGNIATPEGFILGLVFSAVSIFTFVNSILHLVKHKKKAFAITALVISAFPVLAFLTGLVYGIIIILTI